MNNMNFRRQTNCQSCGNCRQQNNVSDSDRCCNKPVIEPRNDNKGCGRQMGSQCSNKPVIEPRNDNNGCGRQMGSQCSNGCNRQNVNPIQNNCNCNNMQSVTNENCAEAISHIDMHNIPIGIGYVPWQKWRKINALCDGLSQGTIFKELSLPFYGCIPNGFCNNKGGTR